MRATGFARANDGQAFLEIAIMAPFLMLLLVSIIDIGRLEHFNMVVGNSARAAVEYGAQNLTTAVDAAGMQAAGLADAQNLATLSVTGTEYCRCSDGSPATCSSTTCPTNTHMLTYAKVVSSYTFKTLFNYRVIPASISLTRTALMQVAQ